VGVGVIEGVGVMVGVLVAACVKVAVTLGFGVGVWLAVELAVMEILSGVGVRNGLGLQAAISHPAEKNRNAHWVMALNPLACNPGRSMDRPSLNSLHNDMLSSRF